MFELEPAVSPGQVPVGRAIDTTLSGVQMVMANEDYPSERIKSGDFLRVDFDATHRPGDGLFLIEIDCDDGVWSGVRRFGRQPHLQVKEDGRWVNFSSEQLAVTRIVGRVMTVFRAVDLTLNEAPLAASEFA